jgi:hypothetical protein
LVVSQHGRPSTVTPPRSSDACAVQPPLSAGPVADGSSLALVAVAPGAAGLKWRPRKLGQAWRWCAEALDLQVHDLDPEVAG